MSNNEPDDEPTDSQQESEQQPADSDQPAEQSEGQSTESDQPAEQSEEQAADDQPAEQVEEEPADSDRPVEQSEEQSADSDQPAAEAQGQPADTSDEQGSQSDNKPAGESDQSTQQAGQESALSPAPKRPYGVESWRPLVTEMAGDIPVEVLLRWIKHESGGNPCSTGKIVNGASIENGLFQLYSPDDDHIATPAQLHGSFCSGQTCIRDLTLQEARIQVASGIAYVRICRERAGAQLKQGGAVWDEKGTDFWALVKMQHNLPSVPKLYIPKLRPSSWSEFKEGVIKQQPKYAETTIFSNAEDIGAAAV